MGLEMSLSKLLFAPAAQHMQIIGMSATSELRQQFGRIWEEARSRRSCVCMQAGSRMIRWLACVLNCCRCWLL